MHKYKWLGILVLVISLVFITSACNKSNIGNQSSGNNVSAPSTTKVEPNSSNGDKNMNNTTVVPSSTPLNKGQGTTVVNSSGVSKDNIISEKIMGSDKEQLSEEDFEMTYKSIRINPSTKVEDITKKLGFPDDYEANNKGYISGNAKYRRWNLCYPSYSKPEIRIIILSERKYVREEVKDGNSYIVGIYLESYQTQKGLKIGDKLEKVLQLYGKPESFENNVLRYSKGDIHIDVTLNDAKEKVDSIFIDYNMEKSEKEQEGAKNQ